MLSAATSLYEMVYIKVWPFFFFFLHVVSAVVLNVAGRNRWLILCSWFISRTSSQRPMSLLDCLSEMRHV